MAEKMDRRVRKTKAQLREGTCPAYATEEYQGNFRKRTGR